jgi:long-chain fatty acid transport protein
MAPDGAVRDPLHDDVFDIELDGSITWNSQADEVTVRFKYDEAAGAGSRLSPVGFLPPIVDQATGFEDSYGLRLGGQYNVVQDKLGLMAGTWYETRSQRPELLNMSQPGPERGGFGGGFVLRQGFMDFTFGYQYHWSSALQTTNGLRRANTGSPSWSINNEPLDLPAEDRREFRSFHIVNNGKMTQHAHAFALGGVVRF